MKKKFISVLAALMVLAMGTTVSAQSPGTEQQKVETYKQAVSEVKAADGTTVEVKAATTEQVQAAETAAEQIKTEQKAEKVTVKAVVDVNLTLAAGQTATLTFTVPSVKAGADIRVLHWDGSKWESASVSGVTVADGKVTATFSSLSPIAFVEVQQVAAAASETPIYSPEWYEAQKVANTDNSAASNTTVTSPKTGEAAFLPMMAVICLAGVVVCARKVKFN